MRENGLERHAHAALWAWRYRLIRVPLAQPKVPKRHLAPLRRCGSRLPLCGNRRLRCARKYVSCDMTVVAGAADPAHHVRS